MSILDRHARLVGFGPSQPGPPDQSSAGRQCAFSSLYQCDIGMRTNLAPELRQLTIAHTDASPCVGHPPSESDLLPPEGGRWFRFALSAVGQPMGRSNIRWCRRSRGAPPICGGPSMAPVAGADLIDQIKLPPGRDTAGRVEHPWRGESENGGPRSAAMGAGAGGINPLRAVGSWRQVGSLPGPAPWTPSRAGFASLRQTQFRPHDPANSDGSSPTHGNGDCYSPQPGFWIISARHPSELTTRRH